jgi:hypothetical protein
MILCVSSELAEDFCGVVIDEPCDGRLSEGKVRVEVVTFPSLV